MSSRPAGIPPQKKFNYVEALAGFICRHALGVLIVFSLLTAALVPVAAKLKLHANFLDLLPASHPSIVNLKDLMSHVGGTSFLVAIIESPDEETARLASVRFNKEAAAFKQVA